ncbi:hypothetical protein D3C86_1586150 [compost metagenome]
MQFDFQLADIGDHVQVIAGPVDIGIDPGPGAGFHEFDGVVDSAPGDTGIDGRLDQLRDCALDVRFVVDLPGLYHQFGVDPHVVEQNRAAGGGALTETGPVIDDAQTGCATADEGQHLPAIVVQRLDRDPVGEQGAG